MSSHARALSAAAPARPALARLLTRERALRWAPVLVLAALVLFLSLANDNFLTVRNAARIGIVAAPALMVAIGVTFIIIMGSIDLSMEGTVAVSAVSFGFVMLAFDGVFAAGGWLGVPAALLVGALIGFANGLVHVKLRIPSFMASLSIGFIGVGLSLLLTGGDRIRVEDELFRALLTVRVLGFPWMVWIALAALLVAWFIQRNTAIGRNFYAVGGGEELAHASGLDVDRVRIIGFTLAGAFFGLAAILAVARIGIAETATGSNLMFVAITSVVVGGTSLMGGVGGVWNTLVGVLIVTVIGNGMIVLGLPNYVQDGVLGLMVIVAVVLATDRRAAGVVK